ATSALSDPGGRFELRLDERPAEVEVKAAGYVDRTVSLAGLPAGEDLAVDLQRAGEVRISVITPAGEPVPEALVYLRRPRGMIRGTGTGPDGTCVLRGLAPGKYEALLSRMRGEPAATVEVRSGETAEVVLTCEPSPAGD
ncbi:MAG TPA: carboxypeptidase-like regulatory domain-containing protein, partial [Planctomycetota bacterium]|nr:carboxypeptidase-like regulatory domain-containing protein [Planctomycetota bacterium]